MVTSVHIAREPLKLAEPAAQVFLLGDGAQCVQAG